MADPTTQFFEELSQRGHDPQLENSRGTLRFDIATGKKTEHWLVTIDKGDVTVSHRGGDADARSRATSPFSKRSRAARRARSRRFARHDSTSTATLRLLGLFRRCFPARRRARRAWLRVAGK